MPFMKQYNLDEFEFSQSHLFFWDKVTMFQEFKLWQQIILSSQIERCNFFLKTIVEISKRGEAVDGRLFSFILQVSYIF